MPFRPSLASLAREPPIPSAAPPTRSASVPLFRSQGTRHGRQSCLNAILAPFTTTPMLHSKRLQASCGQAPSPPARALCARSLRSLAGSPAACATRCRSPAALCWLAAYGLQCARVSRSLGSRFAPVVCKYVRWLPSALWGSRLTRGPPPRSRPCRPSPHYCGHALLRLAAAALATLGRFGRDAPAGSTTFRPNICQAFAGVFRFYRHAAVRLP